MDKKIDKNFFWAIAHLCFALAWGPLSWVICDDIVNYLWGGYDHLIALKWGISCTGIMFNVFMFVYRYSLLKDDEVEDGR